MSTLTAAEVRTILASTGQDWSGLGIRDEPAGVVVYGPEELRTAAFHVLLGKGGLSVAPYSDRDEWTRREGSEEGERRG